MTAAGGSNKHLGRWRPGEPTSLYMPSVCEASNCFRTAVSPKPGNRLWHQHNTSCYMYVPELLSQVEAARHCRNTGAQLAAIGTAEENSIVQRLCGRRACWLGLSRAARSTAWIWQDGSDSAYANWDFEPGQLPGPSSADKQDRTYAAFMNYWIHLDEPPPWENETDHLGYWVDARADGPFLNFVCETVAADGGYDCSPMWIYFQGNCYHRFDMLLNQYDAAKECDQHGASLVSINSFNENEFVRRLCGRRSTWLGLRQYTPTGDWVWPDGTVLGSKDSWQQFSRWDMGEPNDEMEGKQEDAAFMNFWGYLGEDGPETKASAHVGFWHDTPAGAVLRLWYVCQRQPYDGSCPIGWLLFHGFCYLRRRGPAFRNAAVAYCRHHGGDLPKVRDDADNHFLQRLCRKRACWLGLEIPEGSEHWQWPDGTPMKFRKWDMWQPDNKDPLGRREDAAFMNFWEWVDMPSPEEEFHELHQTRSTSVGVNRAIMGAVFGFFMLVAVVVVAFKLRGWITTTSTLERLGGEQARDAFVGAAREQDEAPE